MDHTRCLSAALFATLACAAQAQTTQYTPRRPSVPRAPSVPSVEFDDAGNPRHPGMGSNASATGATAPVPPARATTQMLGAGSFGQSAGLENVLNSGTPPAWDRKAGVRKVCPPELENRNNVCSPPMGSILSR